MGPVWVVCPPPPKVYRPYSLCRRGYIGSYVSVASRPFPMHESDVSHTQVRRYRAATGKALGG